MNCTTCGTEVTNFNVFPGTLCLACFEQTPEANAPLTQDALTNMWRSL